VRPIFWSRGFRLLLEVEARRRRFARGLRLVGSEAMGRVYSSLSLNVGPFGAALARSSRRLTHKAHAFANTLAARNVKPSAAMTSAISMV